MSIDASITVDSVVVEHQTASRPVRALDGVSFTVDTGSSGDHRTQRRWQVDTAGGGRGLARPTSGTVRIGDSQISELSERDRSDFRRSHIGFVYQADNLLPSSPCWRTWDFSYRSTGSLREPEDHWRCSPTSAWPGWPPTA